MNQIETPGVLVVNDDAETRVFLAELLESSGFTVTVAETGEELIASVERARFAAVVVDQEMSDISGFDLVFFMRHRSPGTPVILVSGQGEERSLPILATTRLGEMFWCDLSSRQGLAMALQQAGAPNGYPARAS